MKHFEELDKIYRISEKQEIKKYLEVGKTPKEYYKGRIKQTSQHSTLGSRTMLKRFTCPKIVLSMT